VHESFYLIAQLPADQLRGLIVLAVLTWGWGSLVRDWAVAESIRRERQLDGDECAPRRSVAHLLRLDASFHASKTPGEFIERVDGDVGTLARFFLALCRFGGRQHPADRRGLVLLFPSIGGSGWDRVGSSSGW